MKDKFVSDLSDGYYFDAFTTFAKQTDKYYVKYETDGKGYDVDDLPKDDFSIGFNLLIAVVAGFVIGFIGVSIMKGKLKTVRMQNFAGEYEIPGSMQVTGQNDVFLYANVVATPKPEPSQSSGGGSTPTAARREPPTEAAAEALSKQIYNTKALFQGLFLCRKNKKLHFCRSRGLFENI